MFWRISIVFAVWLCAGVTFAKERVWVSSDGRTMTAEFVRELDGDVTFRKDGKLVVIRLEKLSPPDQQLVKDLSSGKVTDSDPPANNEPASGGDGPTEGKSGKAKKPVVQTRTWTDRFGIKSSGKFVRVDGSDVVISRGNRVLTVPFFNLSENDQQYVRLVLISQGNEDLIPTESTGPSGNGIEDRGGGGGGIAGGGIAGGGIGGAGFPGGAIPPGIGGPGMAGPAGPGIGGPGMAGPGIGPGRGMGMPGIAGGAGFPGAGPMRGPGMSSGIGDPAGLPGGGAGALPPGIAGGPMGAGIGGGIGGPGGPGIGRMAPPDLGPGMASAPRGMMPGMSGPGMGNTGIGGPGMASGMGSMPGSAFPSSATASSSMPPSMMPGMGPASIPPIPEPTFSSPVFEQSFQCSGCGAKISQAESSLSKCPHCGITWGYKQDAFGNKTMTSSGGKLATAGIVILIFVFLGVIVFIALFVGIIVAVVRAAASSSRPPQPQRYY